MVNDIASSFENSFRQFPLNAETELFLHYPNKFAKNILSFIKKSSIKVRKG